MWKLRLEFTKIFTVGMGWLVGCCDYFVLPEGMDSLKQEHNKWEVGGEHIRKKSPTDWVKFSEWEEVTIFLPFFFSWKEDLLSWRVSFTKYARWKRNLTHIFGGQLWMSHKWGWFQSDNFFRGWKKKEFFNRVFSDVYYDGRHSSATLQAWNLTWKKTGKHRRYHADLQCVGPAWDFFLLRAYWDGTAFHFYTLNVLKMVPLCGKSLLIWSLNCHLFVVRRVHLLAPEIAVPSKLCSWRVVIIEQWKRTSFPTFLKIHLNVSVG